MTKGDFNPSPAATAAAVAMLEAADAPATESPAADVAAPVADAPAAQATEQAADATIAAAVADAPASPEPPPPAAPDPAEVERIARAQRLDEQLRLSRASKQAKREEKAAKLATRKQELANVQAQSTKDAELTGKIAEFEADPVDYLLKNGRDAAALMQKLANAAREAGTPDAKIAALEKSMGAKVNEFSSKLEALEKENAALKEEGRQREAAAKQQQQVDAFAQQMANEERAFMSEFTAEKYPYAHAYMTDPQVMRNQIHMAARELRAGRRGAPVPFVDIANRLETYAKTHHQGVLARLAPAQPGSNGSVKSDPKAASAPKGKGATTTLSNDLASQTASNRSRRHSEKERMANAARQLEAMESATK